MLSDFLMEMFTKVVFFKENVRDPISLILGTGIGSLKHLKKP